MKRTVPLHDSEKVAAPSSLRHPALNLLPAGGEGPRER